LSSRAGGYLRGVRKDRLFGFLAGVAAAIVSTFVWAGCGGGTSTSSTPTGADASYLAAVTAAAAATDRVPGYKVAVTSTTTLGAKTVTISGTGAIDDRGREGSIILEVAGRKFAEIVTKPYVYIQLPTNAPASFTHGKPWIRLDLSTFTDSSGTGSSVGGSPDPTQGLTYLRGASAVTRVGSEPVRGVASTHYHAIIDFARLKAAEPAAERRTMARAVALLERLTGEKSLPMDVWIADDGHLLRFSYGIPLCIGTRRLHESLNVELFDFGRQAVVSPPPASLVTDVDPQFKRVVAKALSRIGCG
jgi:hypothetical protein